MPLKYIPEEVKKVILVTDVCKKCWIGGLDDWLWERFGNRVIHKNCGIQMRKQVSCWNMSYGIYMIKESNRAIMKYIDPGMTARNKIYDSISNRNPERHRTVVRRMGVNLWDVKKFLELPIK